MSSPLTLTGLQYGASYSISVSAINAGGVTPSSNTSLFTVPPFNDIIKDFGTWAGTGTATAIIDYDFNKFVDLLFAGSSALVPGQDYIVKEGSTIITFTNAYLNTLPNGTYWFVAEFTDHISDRIELIIKRSIRSGSDSPGTGDDPYTLFLTTSLAIVSALCLPMLFFYYRLAFGNSRNRKY